MIYSKKDVVLAIALMFFIISFAIVFTVFFKQLYYFEISHLQLDKSVGLDKTTIIENYDILINYQSIFYRGDLYLPNFAISPSGRIHFQEVKIIFEFIQILLVISGITSFILMRQQLKQKEYRFFRLTGIITIIIPLIIAFFAALDFDRAFVIFHKLFFRNDYWIFDPQVDPVINILPEAFFRDCFILIILIIIILVSICFGIYRFKQKKIISDTNL